MEYIHNIQTLLYAQKDNKKYIFFRVDLLGSFMQTLELISQDNELKKFLSRSAPALTAGSAKSKVITQKDLPKVIV